MKKKYKLNIAPVVVEQLDELGIRDRAKDAIRDAMSDPERAGKQLTGDFFPYRRLKSSRYRIIYKVSKPKHESEQAHHDAARTQEPIEINFVWAGIRKSGDKKDIYKVFGKALNRGEVD